MERHAANATLRLTGDWIARESGLRVEKADDVVAQANGVARLSFDTSGLGRWDSAIIIFVQALRDAVSRHAGDPPPLELDESGLPEAARRLLALAASEPSEQDGEKPAAPSLPYRVGRRTIAKWTTFVDATAIVGDTVLRGLALTAGRARARAVDVLQMMREAGAGALAIVTIVNGLIGGILAFVGAVQLRRFGADIFVADLVGIALVREMAAVMTAIVMAGRTGGAYAAQIATMQGNEEIDALKAFGIPVFDYLVLPRIIALLAMMPLLYIYACAVGLLGGLAVSVSVLDLTTTAYIEETRRAITATHFLIGLSKSVAFGALVALAGCHIGLRAGRSAADVGKAATSAVVAGIIGVIALDAIFAVCANALNI